MAKTMAKTMAKLQPRAKKTSPKKARRRFTRETEGDGTAEADVQCQPLPGRKTSVPMA